MSELRLGYSPLDGTVFVGKGRLTKDKKVFVFTGNKTDVTKDFHSALIQFLGNPDVNQTKELILSLNRSRTTLWRIRITKIDDVIL